MQTQIAVSSFSDLLKEWRSRRRISQLDLALEAEISQRHLSFMESGRAKPSREMVLRLAEGLDMPLRRRNQMLLAAGFAPGFTERKLDDTALAPAMLAVEQVLKGHEPNPAIAVDRQWNLIAGNRAIGPFLAGVEDAELLKPPVNVLRLSLHPRGLAPRIRNLGPWRAHLLDRLHRQVETSGDEGLERLLGELSAYPGQPGISKSRPHEGQDIAVPLQISIDGEVLSFISTITVFGTPLDISLSELAIESFFPADAATRAILQRMVRTAA
ncbi:helix-turn-helix domain-containing protein [Aliihoeflea aestuarii]|jgi:transcriptional regulator with XRE-family HTH domain|uniref:helix-turn-helix transcriptional regulator n=1 Tax=Aliihoeflea aestuarii TaxID=453840 RepID=UPI002093A606|nr:helix-turn-helix transcriptional regulator [Aliihoeflea aestuarii]MCO6389482.1 helix-turn-helix domain-containing protein [Aliihoeflea aestuarii]